MTPLALLLVAYGVAALWLAALLAAAPEGYEDSEGFHEGREPRP